MKKLASLVIVLALCLIAIPALIPSSPVQAAESITLSDDEGYVGDRIHITGTDFGYYEDYWVYYERDGHWVEVLDEDECDVDSGGNLTTDRFYIPESCTGQHRVRVCDHQSSSSSYEVAYAYFYVEPKVEITTPSTEKGHVDDDITVKGTRFAEDEEDIEVWYYRDSTHHTDFAVGDANEYGSWEKTFKVPASVEGSHDIVAKGHDTDYDDVKEDSFTVEPKISLAPISGCVGDIIEVIGTGFTENEANIKITFDDEEMYQIVEADTDTYGTWEATFEVPICVKGSYEVDARGHYTTYAEVADVTFTVGPGVKSSPASGHVGTVITVNGTGFAANKLVTITYDGITKASATTTSTGSFSDVSFSATHTQAVHTVEHPVVATDTAGNTITINFIMESVPPAKPTLISPIDGARVGFVGKASPTFQWSNVTDESGIIRYELQVSTNSTNFTDPIVSLTIPYENVTFSDDSMSYTLPKDEALSHGTYYWRVKAIDGAENEGEWSEVANFHTGFLPLWALIAIIVLVVVLIGALVYFFAIRPRTLY